MRNTAAFLTLALLLSGCGARTQLKPKEGKSMPVKAEAAPVAATVDQLLTPSTQAQPKRSDEQLKRSEQRSEDKFDLPPKG